MNTKRIVLLKLLPVALLFHSGCGSDTPTLADLSGDATPTPTPSLTPSPTPNASCPSGFSRVAASAALGVDAFCVSKYEMKAKQTATGTAVFDGFTAVLNMNTHSAESRASGVPWVKIRLAEARAECAEMGAGYRLITFMEWEAMASDVESRAANWTGAAVGNGLVPSGHSDGAISGSAVADGYAVAGSNLLGADSDTSGFQGTGQAGSLAGDPGYKQKRNFVLASGDEVWDIAGNAREWVDAHESGSLIDYTGPGASGLYDLRSNEFTNLATTIKLAGTATPLMFAPLVSVGLNHATHNIGRFYILSGARMNAAVTRGANMTAGNSPGIYAGDLDSTPTG